MENTIKTFGNICSAVMEHVVNFGSPYNYKIGIYFCKTFERVVFSRLQASLSVAVLPR